MSADNSDGLPLKASGILEEPKVADGGSVASASGELKKKLLRKTRKPTKDSQIEELLKMVQNVALEVRAQGAEMQALREERDQWKSREKTQKGKEKEPESEEEFYSDEQEKLPLKRAEPERVKKVDTHTTPLEQKLDRAPKEKERSDESPTFFLEHQMIIPEDSPFRPLRTGNKELDELVSPTITDLQGSPSPKKGVGGKLPNVALPRFSGAPGALQNWAVEFHRRMRMTDNEHQSDVWKLDWFVEACSDKVRERVRKLARTGQSFAQILVKLRELTPVLTNSVTVKEEIEAIPRLKTPTPSATETEDLIFSFEYAVDKLPVDSMSTEDILLKFMTKIHPDQLTALRRDNMVAHNLHSLVKTKSLLRKVAANEELLLYLEKQSRKGAQETTPQRNPKNNKPEKNLLGNEEESKCFNCEKPGHFARDCPQPKREEKGGGRKKPEERKQGYVQTSLTCEKCHRKNHIKINCFWNPANPNNKIAEFERRNQARKAREAADLKTTPVKPETPKEAPKEAPQEVVEVKEPKDSNKKRKRALLAKALVNTQG